MSKIGAKPILLKQGVSISTADNKVVVKGPLGEIQLALPEGLAVLVKDDKVTVKKLKDDDQTSASHGTLARLINNAVVGTTTGFEKVLEIFGMGFRGQKDGETLVLSLGFSHPVRFTPPEGIKIEVVENKIKILGIDKEKVGIVADQIRKIKMPDAYKGKGIREFGRKLRLKPGKMAAKVTGAGK
ncbi:MAG: 50S ribosomal protein L6 [Microgenomates group bacterium]